MISMRPLLWRTLRRVPVITNATTRSLSNKVEQRPVLDQIAKLSPIILRDACKCSQCVDQSTLQREFLFSDIPTNIEASPEQDSSGDWIIKWKNDIPGHEEHVSKFAPADIAKISRPPRSDYKPVTMLWDKSTFEKETQSVRYEEFMNEKAGLAKVLWLYRRHGLVFVSDVPSDPESVARVAERIAPLRNTFYGNTWNVRSVPQAKNVAYTSKYLGFHMDLLYMKESPGAQFLHSLENTCEGGESRFMDTLKAYDILASEKPQYAESLKKVMIRYEYDNDGHYYTNTKPVAKLRTHEDVPRTRLRGTVTKNGPVLNISRIYWSPPFVGSILSNPRETKQEATQKLEATKYFAAILERENLVYETKMDAGTCVIFDNLRVVHARNAFDMNSGNRWLRGCYLDSQDVTSRELSLKNEILELEPED